MELLLRDPRFTRRHPERRCRCVGWSSSVEILQHVHGSESSPDRSALSHEPLHRLPFFCHRFRGRDSGSPPRCEASGASVLAGRARGGDSCWLLPVADVVKAAQFGAPPPSPRHGALPGERTDRHGEATASPTPTRMSVTSTRQVIRRARTRLRKRRSRWNVGECQSAHWRRRSRSAPGAAWGNAPAAAQEPAAPATPPQRHHVRHSLRAAAERLTDRRCAGCPLLLTGNPAAGHCPIHHPAAQQLLVGIDAIAHPAAKERGQFSTLSE